METAKVVIGANFGDEGKGLVTNYLTGKFRGETCVNILFNGGAQRAHTVVTPDRRRHVFSHFGSGTFNGARTHFASPFIVNPILFKKELDQLSKLTSIPRVTGSPECRVTTPYDMALNQMIEMSRGINKHGSCGIGINATVDRCNTKEFDLTFRDLRNEFFETALNHMRLKWFPTQFEKYDIDIDDPKFEIFKRIFNSDSVIEKFIADSKYFCNNVELLDDRELSNIKAPGIFEGGQGLLLDQNLTEYFPHVTRSNTGVINVAHIANIAGIKYLGVYYVTRAYETRHGAGPMSLEIGDLNFEDQTNKPNKWQGSLRFGALDLEAMCNRIKWDFCKITHADASLNLAVTCLDQTSERVYIKGTSRKSWSDLPSSVMHSIRLPYQKLIMSTGPTRYDIRIANHKY